ncbi:MAG: chromosome segregation protein SMC [Myxococcaceae bacterium]|jgi:chromosome segregation protein|nr:chromosome segregation protein SMC [Myxococcaceae bacterium]
MRLKRLDITGFKSFMDRTVFSFDDGITAVVGPNGCGKSNVVDAIRWVMGEQSAKNLRGRGMEDVIFNGSETHAPLSMAEVTLTLTVESQDVLPETLAGLPEVSVTRRLFRSGESEYQINKTTCRLLDITELFLGTGVGTKAYSIIEQGRVGQIVSARPEDRRSFIEEAAGITKYKARRRAAERKMESTQQNLLRVNDIVAELEKRLDSLERQARKAEKYKRLRGEMRDIELHHSSHRFLELTAGRSLLTTRLETLTADEKEKLGRVQAMDADISTRREALEAETAALEAAAAEFYALESQVQLDAQNLVHWKEDLESTRARVAAAETELAEVLARKATAEQEKAEAEGELQRLGVASREDEVALEVFEEELRRTVELMAQVTTRLEGERRELVEVLTRVANHESNLANLDTRRADLDQRMERLVAERAVLQAEQTQLEDARREVLARVEQSRQLAIEITQRRGEEETTLQQAREAFTENEVQVLAVRDELSDTRSRLQSLEEIQRNYEGFDRGVRAVMSKAGEDLRQAGIFGLVSDVVTAAPELEKAIEAALGDQLQHVIVETPERGVEYVEYLKSLGEGRSTFVPVGSDGLEVLPPLEGPEVRAMALSQVQVKDEALRGLVERLLNGVVVVHDLESARSLATRAAKYTFVTVDGEVLRPGGVVTGGVMEGPAVGALHKKRQIAELADQVKRLEERYQELITRHYELQKQVGQLEGVLKGLEKNRHQEELQLQGHEKDLSQAASSLVKLRERIAGLDAELSQLEATKNLLSVDLESSRGEVMHGQTDKQAREERVALLQSELEALTAKNEATRAEATSLKVKVASSSERGSSARQRADTLFTQVNELTERAGRLSTTKDEGVARIAELEQRLSETGAGREEREAKLSEARGGIDARKEAHAAEVAKVRDEEHQLKELRTSAEALTHELAELTLKSRELSLEMEHLASTVQERHGVAMHEAISMYHTHPQLGAEAVERLKELRAQVEKMGEVNVTAIEEHQEIAQRFEFLSKQKKDLEASLEQLTEAIKTIDETSRQRFKETFDVVNDKFQQVFPRLFGGGRASLLLTQEPGSSEPGIEILAQPPGKKLQSVNLFSGGEKALTAVALIFGIFLIKPTPFCLLDEVDAPLDEGNVGRYNDMVKEMSKTSQFILITHNKRTMEIGDTLYGVTMEEPGVSKLVAVNLKEAAANTDQQVA